MHQSSDLPIHLIVLADPTLHSAVELVLRVNGTLPQATLTDSTEVRSYIWNAPVDLLLIESQVPNVSVEQLCREIQRFFRIPILVIVKEINERQFIDLLDSGADDIVICASNLAEIPARCRMLARRRRRQVARDPASAYLEAGDLRLDIARHSLLLPDQQRVALTSQQTRLLAMFISMPDMCVAMATLSQHVFDRPVNYVQQRLSALFYSLNQRLQQYAYAPQIVSVRQQGYRLILPSPDAQPPR